MKAVPSAEQPGFIEDEVDRAGDAMVMLIPRSMWTTLVLQGRSENTGPAQVLDKAFRAYLEAHGSEEAVAYLHRIAEVSRAG